MKNINLYRDNVDFLAVDPAKTIFWVGAGVGVLPPCSLPLGNGLTDAILEAAIGEENTKTLIRLWNDKFPKIRSRIQNNNWMAPAGKRNRHDSQTAGSMNERPRLEFIIGEVHKLDIEFQDICFRKESNRAAYRRTSVITSLKYFAAADPNSYHYALADFMRAGATMVTTNFDVCIEKAYGLREDEMKIRDTDGIPAVECGPGRFVYHIHGVATDKEIERNLGATLTNVSKSVPPRFADKLCRYFEEGYTIVFIGYGGVDFFDIRPFFDSLKGRSFPGKAVYLHYCAGEASEEEMAGDKAYKYLLAPFQEQYICYGDTAVFQSALACRSGIVSTDCPTLCVSETAFSKTRKALSDNIAAYTQANCEKYRFINLFRIASQLNISLEYFYEDWVERLMEIYNDWKEDAPDQAVLKEMIWKPKDIARCIVDDIRNNNWYSRNKVYRAIRREILPMFEVRRTSAMNGVRQVSAADLERNLQEYVSQTCRILDEEVDDDDSLQIETATVLYLCGSRMKKLYVRWIFGVHRRETEKELTVLLDCLNRLAAYPYHHFRYMTFYIALNRGRHVLNAILDKEPVIEADGKGRSGFGDIYSSETKCYGDIQSEWNICMEIPDLFDAGKVVQGLLEQYFFLFFRGRGLHLRKMCRLLHIRREIIRLRKGK